MMIEPWQGGGALIALAVFEPQADDAGARAQAQIINIASGQISEPFRIL